MCSSSIDILTEIVTTADKVSCLRYSLLKVPLFLTDQMLVVNIKKNKLRMFHIAIHASPNPSDTIFNLKDIHIHKMTSFHLIHDSFES